MRTSRVFFAFALISSLFLIAVPLHSASAQWTLIWESELHSYLCPPVISPVLEAGREYLIEIQGTFASYNMSGITEYAMDAYYYSIIMEPSGDEPDIWVWDNHHPAPDGHSFVQIDGSDVNWGPFNNGVTSPWGGHEYSIVYTGAGAPITFTIEEWLDPLRDCVLNYCHFHIRIYEGPPLPPEGETAFAYGGDYATCFLCLGFRNWGWTNGPLGPGYYEFEIWAGAAQCDLSKGELVGTLAIGYDGSGANITYMMDAGWMMQNTQLYVGSEMLPRNKKGDFTVSPGQYPYIHEGIDATFDVYSVSGLSGDIYVVAHADVVEA